MPSPSVHLSYSAIFSSTTVCCISFPAQGVPPDRAAEAALRPPPAIAAALDAYAAHFAALKSPRKLHWKPHLGLVSLEVCCERGCDAKCDV